jgi:sugar lactone lactonase YvrE
LPGYEWSIESGNLPAGLTLSSNGCITGTITEGGNFTVTIKVKDQNEIETTKSFSFFVYNELIITSACPLAFGTNGTAYLANLSAIGGNPPYIWSVPAPSTLPLGLNINANTGAISGTPKVTGNFTFNYRVADSCGNTATKNCSIRIFEPLKILDQSILSCLTTNRSVNPPYCLSASGGLAPYEWSIVSGSLPAGLSFSSNGCISGNITQSGNFSVSIKVKDQNGTEIQKTFSFTTYKELIISSVCPMPFGTNATTYSANLTASGGNPLYSWSLVSPSTLPTGISLNASTGKISGKPLFSGNFSFTYKVLDACGNTATKNCTISIYEPLKIPTNEFFSCVWVGDDAECFQVQATGGFPAYSWAAVNLPPTLTINATSGKICGNFTQAGNITSAVRVTDQNGTFLEKTFTTEVNAPLQITTTCPLPNGKVEEVYNTTLTATGGKPPYSWQILPQIYVADYNNNKIKKFTENGPILTYAGNGVNASVDGSLASSSFNGPYGLDFDVNGNLYVADRKKIRKISSTGNVTTLSGDFSGPEDIVVDNYGNVYVADANNHDIKRIDTGGNVTQFAGNGTAGFKDGIGLDAQFNYVQGICWDLNGNMILADDGNNRIRKITLTGNVTTVAGNAAGYKDGIYSNAMFNRPHDVKVHQDGVIYVLDHNNECIRTINGSGIVGTLGNEKLKTPYCLSVDKNGFVYVSDGGTNYDIKKISPTGNVTLVVGSGNFSSPRGIEINPFEDLPLGLTLNSTTGKISGTPKANGLYNITYQVTDSCGNKVISNCTLTIASNKPEFNYELPWKFTDSGSIALGHNGSLRNYTSTSMPAGALWSVSADNLTLKVSWENSQNCSGGNNPNNQIATATINMTTTKSQKIGLSWIGIGELQASNYDKMQVYIDGVLIGSANAAGGGKGCQMGPVISVNNYPSGYNLSAGNHTILINATTQDGLYHTGSYYQFTFSLVE